jgi:hypothetical protein
VTTHPRLVLLIACLATVAAVMESGAPRVDAGVEAARSAPIAVPALEQGAWSREASPSPQLVPAPAATAPAAGPSATPFRMPPIASPVAVTGHVSAGLVADPTLAPVDPIRPAEPATVRKTWTLDLYDARAPRWQEPDSTACTAAATVSMLNTIAYNGWDPDLIWQPNVSFSKQEQVLAFERSHMTMRKTSPGSDAHGWRNALNYYGWGSIDAGVYRDAAYPTMVDAEKALVSALARYRKPVGVLAQWGAHAQFATGYRVVGDDPRTGSMNFTVLAVYLTDPWHTAHYRDTYVTVTRWQYGFSWLRFAPYEQKDSPYRDPIDGHVGISEWLGRWVLVEPTR